MRVYDRSSGSATDRAEIVGQLRELCAWYEWGSGSNYPVVAEVLQDAADAVQVHALSLEAAGVLIRVWGYFVGREAAVGNKPPSYEHETDLALLRAAVDDLHRNFESASEADKPRLAELLREQIVILERAEKQGASHG